MAKTMSTIHSNQFSKASKLEIFQWVEILDDNIIDERNYRYCKICRLYFDNNVLKQNSLTSPNDATME